MGAIQRMLRTTTRSSVFEVFESSTTIAALPEPYVRASACTLRMNSARERSSSTYVSATGAAKPTSARAAAPPRTHAAGDAHIAWNVLHTCAGRCFQLHAAPPGDARRVCHACGSHF